MMETMIETMDSITTMLWSLVKCMGCLTLIILITVGIWVWVMEKLRANPYMKFRKDIFKRKAGNNGG